MSRTQGTDDSIGPVIQATPLGRAVVAAIQQSDPRITIQDEGAYLRVKAQRRCRLSKAEVEAQLGERVAFPGDLEVVMPSFAGVVAMNEHGAVWWHPSERPPEMPSP